LGPAPREFSEIDRRKRGRIDKHLQEEVISLQLTQILNPFLTSHLAHISADGYLARAHFLSVASVLLSSVSNVIDVADIISPCLLKLMLECCSPEMDGEIDAFL
jgi:hypothetical protein